MAFYASKRDPETQIGYVVLLTLGAFIIAYINNRWTLEQLAIPIVLPFLRRYNGQREKRGKWLFYIFYSAHLLVFGFLRWGLRGFM